jgi:RNA polymerase sigma-70 factor, ECF subfamily
LTIQEVPSEQRSDDEVETEAPDDTLAVLAGDDPSAFETLYFRYRDRVYLYLLRRVGNVEDAADVTQQVFLKALSGRSKYRPEKGSFAAWLFAIAHNSANSALKRRKPSIAWDLVPESSIPRVDHALDARRITEEELDWLRTCLARLDSRTQEMIALRFESGLRVSDIAHALGMRDEAAKKALQRGLKKLKEFYDDRPY